MDLGLIKHFLGHLWLSQNNLGSSTNWEGKPEWKTTVLNTVYTSENTIQRLSVLRTLQVPLRIKGNSFLFADLLEEFSPQAQQGWEEVGFRAGRQMGMELLGCRGNRPEQGVGADGGRRQQWVSETCGCEEGVCGWELRALVKWAKPPVRERKYWKQPAQIVKAGMESSGHVQEFWRVSDNERLVMHRGLIE